jgi:Xaa-Pro aminopeptidase
MKSIKSDLEIENLKKVNIIDGSMIIRGMSWLFDNYKEDIKTSEEELSKKLVELRSEECEFICHSFEPIIGSGKNSSIIHYDCNN